MATHPGDVHPNPGPTIKYPCPVCALNVTGRGVSYLCDRCSGWVRRNHNRYQRQFQTKLSMGINSPSGNSTQWYRQHTDVKVAVIQESKLSSNCKHPELHHSTKGPSSMPSRWFTHLDSHVNKLILTRDIGRTSFGGVNHHDHAVRHGVDHYQRLHSPTNSCAAIYLHSVDHLMMTTDTLIRGYFNTHHSAWYSSSTDTRDTLLENMISGTNFWILNWDSPTRLPGNANPSPPDVSLAPASLITSTKSQTKTNLGSNHLPSLISLQMDLTIKPRLHRTSFNIKKAIACDRYRKEIEDKLSKRRLPTNCQKEENIYPLDNTVLIQIRFQWKYWKGWEHETTSDPEIPHRLRCNRWTMRSPEQQTNIGEIHGDSSWRHWTTGYTLPNCGELSRQYTANHRQNLRTKPSLLMTLIIFPNYFNRQFTTSKLGRHTSSRETRIGSREIKRKSLMSAVMGFCDNSLQVVELSGHPDLQIVVNASLQTVSSTVFRIRNSLQRLSWLITHKSRNDARTSGDHG